VNAYQKVNVSPSYGVRPKHRVSSAMTRNPASASAAICGSNIVWSMRKPCTRTTAGADCDGPYAPLST